MSSYSGCDGRRRTEDKRDGSSPRFTYFYSLIRVSSLNAARKAGIQPYCVVIKASFDKVYIKQIYILLLQQKVAKIIFFGLNTICNGEGGLLQNCWTMSSNDKQFWFHFTDIAGESNSMDETVCHQRFNFLISYHVLDMCDILVSSKDTTKTKT